MDKVGKAVEQRWRAAIKWSWSALSQFWLLKNRGVVGMIKIKINIKIKILFIRYVGCQCMGCVIIFILLLISVSHMSCRCIFLRNFWFRFLVASVFVVQFVSTVRVSSTSMSAFVIALFYLFFLFCPSFFYITQFLFLHYTY